MSTIIHNHLSPLWISYRPHKKQTLKAYIDNYIKSKEVCSISLYPSTTGTRQVSGLGHINQGAGVAIGDIDKNGRPDMILMGIDNPKGKNNFGIKSYMILMKMDTIQKNHLFFQFLLRVGKILEVISPSVIWIIMEY